MFSKLISLFKCAKRKVEDEFITPSGKNFALWIADHVNKKSYDSLVKGSKSCNQGNDDWGYDDYFFDRGAFIRELESFSDLRYVFGNLLIMENEFVVLEMERYIERWSKNSKGSGIKQKGKFDVPVTRVIHNLISNFDSWEYSKVSELSENELKSWIKAYAKLERWFYGGWSNRELEIKFPSSYILRNNGVEVVWGRSGTRTVSFGESSIQLTVDEEYLIETVYQKLESKVSAEIADKVRAEREALDRIAAEKAAAEKKIKDEQIKAERIAFDNKIANAL